MSGIYILPLQKDKELIMCLLWGVFLGSFFCESQMFPTEHLKPFHFPHNSEDLVTKDIQLLSVNLPVENIDQV